MAAILANLPWGIIAALIMGGGMLWLIVSQAKSGAVDRIRLGEAEQANKLRDQLNELRQEHDRLSIDDKRDRLLDKYSRD